MHRIELVVGFVVAGALVASDLLGSRASSLRQFDPDAVARLETNTWRSYYDLKRLRLFGEMGELLRTQYGLPYLRSNVVAFHATRAAFVFKRGHGREDYEKALPSLVRYYAAIRRGSDIPFDVQRAAKLELEWWIVHREREHRAPEDLARALGELQAEIYKLPVESLMEHARLRAQAMVIRDTQARAGGVTDADWARIEELLRGSWHALHDAVNAVTPESGS
jgi:hypothetical protein